MTAADQLKKLNKAIRLNKETILCMQTLHVAMLAQRDQLLRELESAHTSDAIESIKRITGQSIGDVQ